MGFVRGPNEAAGAGFPDLSPRIFRRVDFLGLSDERLERAGFGLAERGEFRDFADPLTAHVHRQPDGIATVQVREVASGPLPAEDSAQLGLPLVLGAFQHQHGVGLATRVHGPRYKLNHEHARDRAHRSRILGRAVAREPSVKPGFAIPFQPVEVVLQGVLRVLSRPRVNRVLDGIPADMRQP